MAFDRSGFDAGFSLGPDLPVDSTLVFPSVRSYTQGAGLTSGTSFQMTLPATVAKGDLLCAIINVNGDTTITFDNSSAGIWVEYFQNSDGGPTTRTGMWIKVADGTESGILLTINISATANRAWIVFSFAGVYWNSTPTTILQGNLTTVASSTVTPPLLTLSEEHSTLWMAMVVGHNGSIVVSSFPTGYPNTYEIEYAGPTGARVAVALKGHRELAEQPGAFTMSSSDNNLAFTGAIRPAIALRLPSLFCTPMLKYHRTRR